MNKVFGKKENFIPIREEWSRYVVSHSMEPTADGKNVTWCEIEFAKNELSGAPTLEQIKKAIKNDINEHTDQRILSGFVWNGNPVWLSTENQKNFSEAQRAGEMNPERFTPITFKLGELEDETPVYHEFSSPDELTDFYYEVQEYIRQCIADGWKLKDSIDWDIYKL